MPAPQLGARPPSAPERAEPQRRHEERAGLAAVNAPSSVVISGPGKLIHDAVATLQREGVAASRRREPLRVVVQTKARRLRESLTDEGAAGVLRGAARVGIRGVRRLTGRTTQPTGRS